MPPHPWYLRSLRQIRGYGRSVFPVYRISWSMQRLPPQAGTVDPGDRFRIIVRSPGRTPVRRRGGGVRGVVGWACWRWVNPGITVPVCSSGQGDEGLPKPDRGWPSCLRTSSRSRIRRQAADLIVPGSPDMESAPDLLTGRSDQVGFDSGMDILVLVIKCLFGIPVS